MNARPLRGGRLCHLTSSRSLMVQVSPSGPISQDLAFSRARNLAHYGDFAPTTYRILKGVLA